MPVESDADRLAFLADFDDPATYTPEGGSAVSLKGIFDAEHEVAAEFDGPGGGVSSSRPQFVCRTADVAANPVGGRLVVGTTAYTIVDHWPDGTGMSTLILEKQT